MARSLKYIFPAGDTQAVCKTQAMAGAGSLILDGNLSNPLQSHVSFIDQGYSRSVSITSTADLSTRTIAIRGVQNGVSVAENITGPNNTTVYSEEVYDQINSVSINNSAANISVGTGWQGFFRLIGINLERDVINYTLTISKIADEGSIPFVVLGTIDNIFNNNKTIVDNITDDSVFIIKASGVEDQYIYTNAGNPTYSTLIVSLGDADDTIDLGMQLNFLQI